MKTEEKAECFLVMENGFCEGVRFRLKNNKYLGFRLAPRPIVLKENLKLASEEEEEVSFEEIGS